MSDTVNRIREALRNGQVVLDRGHLQIAGETPPKASSSGHLSAVPRTRQTAASRSGAGAGDVPEFDEDSARLQLKPTIWGTEEPWYVKPRYEQRLAMEVKLLRAQFPDARLSVLADGQLAWSLRVLSLAGRVYDCVLVYPGTFPAGEISAFVLSPSLQSSPHQFGDGRLCLGHSFGRETSAVTTALWVAAWVSAYEVYCETGAWPEFQTSNAA